MNGLEIIYLIGALAIGFLVGMIVEMFCENGVVYDLKEENRRLQEALQKEKAKKREVIEIYDKWSINGERPDEEITFPNKSGF
jgi:hypothetical protein